MFCMKSKKRKSSLLFSVLPSRERLFYRSFSTSIVLQSSKCKSSNPPSKCRTIADICEEKEGYKQNKCSKSPSQGNIQLTNCIRNKPKCKDIENGTKKLQKLVSKNKCSQDCLPKRKHGPPSSKARVGEKQVYPPPRCPPPKIIQPQPCPQASVIRESCEEKDMEVSKRPNPLPKPPSKPVVLCPCPPPPKLPPGSCPCVQEGRMLHPSGDPPPPCPPKPKYLCSDRSFNCPSTSNKCKSGKKNKRK